MSDDWTRRRFLTAAGAVAVSPLLLEACDLSLSPSVTKRASVAGGREAPQLADLVKQGKLPPLDQRLPENPLVVRPVEQPGRYGGDWRTALTGTLDDAWLLKTVGYNFLLRWDPEWKGVLPNLAEHEANANDTVHTFRLRRGLKWSDGTPVTADDLMFTWEDRILNRDLSPGGPVNWLRNADGSPATVTKVDDHTVRVTYATPNAFLPLQLCSQAGGGFMLDPSRWLKQFHMKYNPQGVDKLVKDAGLTTWMELFNLRRGSWATAQRPTLNAWVVTAPLGQGSRFVVERNPYFWKVDGDQRQLPYIDRVVYELVGTIDVMLLKALNGEIDMHVRHFNTQKNKAVLIDHQKQGGYRLFPTQPTFMNVMVIQLNLNHKDPARRALFQNRDFRIGLSHAINRQEIIDTVYQSQGQPWQAAPRPDSKFFHQRLAKQYTEFDLQKAGQFLDRAGLAARDAEGFRLTPDGKRVSFSVEVVGSGGFLDEGVDVLQLVQRHWRRAGIEMQVKNEDRTLFYARKAAADHDAVVWQGDGHDLLEPRFYVPVTGESSWAVNWAAWYSSLGRLGERPPDDVVRHLGVYDQVRAAATDQDQRRLMKQMLDTSADQFYVMGISLTPRGYGIVKRNFRNVPATMLDGFTYPNPGPTNPEQYWIDQPG